MQPNITNNIATDISKISVVMSVYNGSKYLGSSIESILNQTFQNFEFIIVNDASTDNTEEILKQFDDPRIKIINNSVNLGLTKSLNSGINIARGEYIARMDVDDISLPLRFERQVNFLENNPDYALIGSRFYSIDENGNMKSLIEVFTDDLDIRKELKKQNSFAHGSIMMRKDAFLQVGGYDERFQFSQDYDLWLRIAETYKIANIEEPLYKWRVSKDAISEQKFTEQFYYATLARSNAEKREFQKRGTLKSSNELQGMPSITDQALTINWKRTAQEMGKVIIELREYIDVGQKQIDERDRNWQKQIDERDHNWQAYVDELKAIIDKGKGACDPST